MYISDAKVKEHCSNISRDILDSVLYCFSETAYDIITFFICIKRKYCIPKTKEGTLKRKPPFPLNFEKPFK